MHLLAIVTILMTLPSTTHTLKVGIIGGGASGLASARVFLREGHSPVVIEKGANIGGVWDYDATGDPSRPMYKGLRTNLPREIMAYREKKWGGGPGKR